MDISGSISALLPPILDIKAYSELTNQKLHVVQNQVNTGVLPTVQPTGNKGKIFINMVALTELCAKAEENKEPHNRATWF